MRPSTASRTSRTPAPPTLSRRDSDTPPAPRILGYNEMSIRRSQRPVPATRIGARARELLDASTLCAIATVDDHGRSYINTAYFAWSREFELVWVSEQGAKHSKNLA